MKSLIRTGTLGLTILLSVTFQGNAAFSDTRGFSDVPASHLNFDAITHVHVQGIVQGYADGTFRPGNAINRAEFVKIIIEATEHAYLDQYAQGRCFTDVGTEWFARYACYAKAHAVISGYADGTFRPNQAIPLTEAAKIMVNAFLLPQGGVVPGDPWYKRFLEGLASRNAIPTSLRSLAQPLTRADMAEIVYRVSVGITDKPSRTYGELTGLIPMSAMLVGWGASGGLCPYGGCGDSVHIYADGKVIYSAHEYDANTKEYSTRYLRTYLGTSEIADLQTVLSALDIDEVKKRPFTGTCPTAYDGSEYSYTFSCKGRVEELKSCQYVLDQEVFAEITRIAQAVLEKRDSVSKCIQPPACLCAEKYRCDVAWRDDFCACPAPAPEAVDCVAPPACLCATGADHCALYGQGNYCACPRLKAKATCPPMSSMECPNSSVSTGCSLAAQQDANDCSTCPTVTCSAWAW